MGATNNLPPRELHDKEVLEEMRATRREIAALRKLFDEFARVFLAAKFPYGRPTDRWAGR
jgi:hypothetical protein